MVKVNNFKLDGHLIPISYDRNKDGNLQVSELNIWCKENNMKYSNKELIPIVPYGAKDAPKKIDIKKYSYENLKKRYPKDKYIIRTSGIPLNWIRVQDKNTSKEILSLYYTPNGEIYLDFTDLNDNFIMTTYDNKGYLLCSSSYINGERQSYHKITNKIRQDFLDKKNIKNSKENLEHDIYSLTSANVRDVLEEYSETYGTSLIADIFNKKNLDGVDKAKYAKYIVDKLCESFDQTEQCDNIRERFNNIIDQKYLKNNGVSIKELEKLVNLLLNYQIDSSSLLANDIDNELKNKKPFGIPMADKNLLNTVKCINSENVSGVLMSYTEQNDGNTLLDDIIERYDLKFETRKVYINHIITAYLDFAKEKGIKIDDLEQKFNKEIQYQMDKFGFANADYLNVFIRQLEDRIGACFKNTSITTPNGKIDEAFNQGSTGDCWLLASIKAIASRSKGLQILNDSVKVNNDGSVIVTLKGVNKTYTISKEELESNIQFSSGDGDVRALEIAVNKYFEEERGVNNSLDIDGNFAFVAYEILTGKSVEESKIVKVTPREVDTIDGVEQEHLGKRLMKYMLITDEMIDEFNNINKVFTVSATSDKKRRTLDSSSSEQVLHTKHAYAIIRSDSNYVYLVDPYNSSSELKVTREEFKEFFNCLQEMEL